MADTADTAACRCPKCGNEDATEMHITETFTAYHPIRWAGRDELQVENALGTECPSEHFDDGKSDHGVHCNKCLHTGTPTEFNLPACWDWV
jgi:hypothetical protein